MNFLELAKKRHSVRKYDDRKVEEEKLLSILEAGRVAPTAANYQPQRLLVIKEKDGLEKLKKSCKTYNAPVAIVVCSDHTTTWKRPFDGKDTADIDASIITDHMMLEAANQGLGSVWICYFDPDILRKEFNIPENYEPINILCVGYSASPAESPDRHDSKRKPLTDTVFYEKF